MNIHTAREILSPLIWAHPRDYGGFSPDGDYVIATQNRDSDALARSNYRRILSDLQALPYPDDMEPPAYDFRAGHWAVGWVEYIIVSSTAPDDTIIAAAEIVAALSDYPVYDEEDYSELEYSEACDYWARCSVRERAHMIAESRCGASIFAARRDYLPNDDNGALMEQLRA
jgi:hypothetical protein